MEWKSWNGNVKKGGRPAPEWNGTDPKRMEDRHANSKLQYSQRDGVLGRTMPPPSRLAVNCFDWRPCFSCNL
eukprot:1157747-Pelagomonas_calceolata.AAC.3